MLKAIEVKETDYVVGADAVCVLYAKVRYAMQDRNVAECQTPINGIFQTWPLEMAPRKDQEGFWFVYAWCNVNDIKFEETEEEGCWVVLKVPPNGLIELPGYSGDLISHLNIA